MFGGLFKKSEKKIISVPVSKVNETIMKHSFNPNAVEEVRFYKHALPTIVYLNLMGKQSRTEVPVSDLFAHTFVEENGFKRVSPIGGADGAVIYVNPDAIAHIHQKETGRDIEYVIIFLSGNGYRLAENCSFRKANTL